jgi:GT2 family glycosyltransferase
VAPRLVLSDGSTQQSLHSFPTIPFSIALNLGLPLLSPGLGDRMLLPGRYDADRPRDVPWALGAFLLIRRRAFEAIGGFEERQWMYAEDLDLGWRLAKAGWTTRYAPAARVRHVSAAATQGAFGDQTRERFMRATYGVLLRRRGVLRMRLTALVNVCGSAVRILLWAPVRLLKRRPIGQLSENRLWFAAHLEGLRSRSVLTADGPGEAAG